MKGKTRVKHMKKQDIIELIKENCQIKNIDEKNLSKHYAKVLHI